MADWFLRICNRSLLLLQRVLYRPFHEPHHILIFRTGSLGDSICALPAIKSILHFFPDASVDVLTNTGGRGLVGLHHLLPSTSYREVISYEGYSRIQLFRLLKKRHYDLVIQLPQVDAPFLSLVRDAFFFRGVSKSGFGWQKSQIPLFRRTQFRHLQFQNEVSRLNKLLSAHSITVLPHEVILEPMEKEYTAVREFLHSNGLTHSQQLVAIVPGAKRPQNRWPLSYFDQLIEKLSIDYNIILIGSEQDKTLSGMLTTRPNVYDACGVFTPMESAAMLRLCRLTISNDTGPMHLSYSVGTPTLALFSSRDLPGKWSPAGEANEVLRGMHVPCEACFTETCQNNICMQSISVDTVYHKAMEMLSRR